MTKRHVWAVMAVAALGVGLVGCGDDDDDSGGTTPPATCTPPATATVRFSTDVHPILTANCTPCHGDAGTAQKYGSATMGTSYTAAQAKVNTAAPAESQLLVMGNGGTTASPHPGGDKLSAAESATIQTWITECAQNN